MSDAVARKGQFGKLAAGARVPLWAVTWLTVAVPDAAANPLFKVHAQAATDPDLAVAARRAEFAEGAATGSMPLLTMARVAHRQLGGHHRFHFGACAAAMIPLGEELHQSLGGEVFVEWNAVPGWMALELSAGGMTLADGAQLVVNLLYKKSFLFNAWLSPYLGVGPIFVPTVNDEQSNFEYGVGGAAVAGTHIWLTAKVGLVTELKYNLLHQSREEDPGLAHELGVGAGFVFAH